jgi:hypothetical protein
MEEAAEAEEEEEEEEPERLNESSTKAQVNLN